jgi:hypothetical protein
MGAPDAPTGTRQPPVVRSTGPPAGAIVGVGLTTVGRPPGPLPVSSGACAMSHPATTLR